MECKIPSLRPQTSRPDPSPFLSIFLCLSDIIAEVQAVHMLHPRLSNLLFFTFCLFLAYVIHCILIRSNSKYCTFSSWIAFLHYFANIVCCWYPKRILLRGCCIVTGIQINFHSAATPYLWAPTKLKAKKIDPQWNFAQCQPHWQKVILASQTVNLGIVSPSLAIHLN